MDNKTIGKRLRAVRESAGLTQEQVAKYLDIKREIVSYIETGARPINTLMLRRLSDLYGYKFSYFVDESVKGDGPQVSMAFRVSDLSDSDLPIIAQVKKIALNLDSLYNLLGE
jgi:transcriptional regulator with XRE-family HTH domain